MKKLLVLFTVLAVSLSLTACGEKVSKTDEERVVNSFLAYSEKEHTNMKMNGNITMSMEGMSIEMTIDMEAFSEEIMYMNLSTGGLFDVESYVVKNDEGKYVSYTYSTIFGEWLVEETDVAPENDNSFNTNELIDKALVDVMKYTGTETKDGETYDVLEITLDDETFKLLAEAGGAVGDMTDGISFEDLGEFEYKILMDKDGNLGYLIMKVSAEGTEMNMELRVYDYGKVKEIVVPQEIIDKAKTMEELYE